MKIPGEKRGIIFLLVCISIMAAAAGLYAQTPESLLDSWYSSQVQSDRYLVIKPEISTVLQELASLGIPLQPLLDRLNEGAAKKVRPDLLRREIVAEKSRLIQADILLRDAGLDFEDAALREKGLKNLSIFLRGGLDRETILILLKKYSQRGNDWDRMFNLIYLMVELHNIKPMEQELYLELFEAFMKEGATRHTYDTLSSLYLLAQTRGFTGALFVELTIESLGQRGDLTSLSRAIERRSIR